jgi:single-stranded DNA-binding protein
MISWPLQHCAIAVFGKAAETAADLKKGDRVYVEGSIKLDSWRGNDGLERHGLSVAAFKCERTHNIGRGKPKRPRDNTTNDSNATAAGGAPFADEIPFMPEWR